MKKTTTGIVLHDAISSQFYQNLWAMILCPLLLGLSMASPYILPATRLRIGDRIDADLHEVVMPDFCTLIGFIPQHQKA